jgi:hypothetical protein
MNLTFHEVNKGELFILESLLEVLTSSPMIHVFCKFTRFSREAAADGIIARKDCFV